MNDELLIMASTFAAVTLAGYFVSSTLLFQANNPGKHLRSRLADQGRPSAVARRAPGLIPLLQRIGQAAAGPFMPKSREKQSGLRQSLARAGIYSPSAVKIVTGSKVLLLFGGMFGGYLLGLAVDICCCAYRSAASWGTCCRRCGCGCR